jgi:hypothetical protein
MSETEGELMIDYERAKRNGPKLKSALTRAQKVADPIERKDAVIAACRKAVKEWEVWGAWPDAWSRWQGALRDAVYAAQLAGATDGLALMTLDELV